MKLTCTSENLCEHIVGGEIIEDVALVNTNRSNNTTRCMHGKISHLTSMGGKACQLISILKDLY